MATVISELQELLQQLMKMQWSDYLDIAIVAFLIYKLVPMIRSTGTMRIAKVAIGVVVVAWLTDALNLHTISFLLNQLLGLLNGRMLFHGLVQSFHSQLAALQFPLQSGLLELCIPLLELVHIGDWFTGECVLKTCLGKHLFHGCRIL